MSCETIETIVMDSDLYLRIAIPRKSIFGNRLSTRLLVFFHPLLVCIFAEDNDWIMENCDSFSKS